MKNKYIVLIIMIGVLCHIIGAFLKIAHYQFAMINGNVVLLVAFSIEIIGVLLLLYKLISSKKFRDVMKQ